MTHTVCAAHRRAWHPLTANRWTNRGWLRCAARSLARSLTRDDNVCIYVRKPRERTAGSSIFRRPFVEGTRRGRGKGKEREGKSYSSPIRESRSPSFSFSPSLSFIIRTHTHTHISSLSSSRIRGEIGPSSWLSVALLADFSRGINRNAHTYARVRTHTL